MNKHVPSPSRPPHRPVKGMVYKVVGWAMMGAAGLIAFVGISIGTKNTPGVLVLAMIVLFVWGAVILIRGKKYSAARGEELLAEDARPPILYLRSFRDEIEDNRFSNFLRLALFGGQTATATSPWGPREQEELATLMATIGPYIAIGRPGEPLPEMGAARMYISDQQWQEKVGALLDRARLVVVRAGHTEGLRWEVRQLVDRLQPTQVLFILPAARRHYEPFRRWANQVLPHPFPEKAPRERLVMFDNHWRPVSLPTRSTLGESLAPFFEHNGIKKPG